MVVLRRKEFVVLALCSVAQACAFEGRCGAFCSIQDQHRDRFVSGVCQTTGSPSIWVVGMSRSEDEREGHAPSAMAPRSTPVTDPEGAPPCTAWT